MSDTSIDIVAAAQPSPRTDTEKLRVILFAGVEPGILMHLVNQIERKVPNAQVCGILYHQQRRKTTVQRIRNFLENAFNVDYARYVANRVVEGLHDITGRLQMMGLRFLHAYFPCPENAAGFGLHELKEQCVLDGYALRIATDVHSNESMEFVQSLAPDLGISFGAPILKPQLFKIPRFGSINLHERKLPAYRGGGPIALWEMLDGKDEIGVTVHRVEKTLDSGSIIETSTIPIEPYDSLKSLALKAHVVGVDLLVRAVEKCAAGSMQEKPQTGPARTYRSPKPQEMRRYVEQLTATRQAFVPQRGRPFWKLLVRCLFLGPYVGARNWYRRLTGSFPIIVLYHHLISDRPHFLGMSTDQFVRQMQYLRRYYNIVGLRDAMLMLKSGKVYAPTIVITFDDGYRDNHLTLRAAGLTGTIPATLFICSQRVESQQPFTHDLDAGFQGFTPLSWGELADLQRSGFHIGSHTRTHLDCGTNDVAILEDEIVGARKDIESRLKCAVESFSFPFGQPPNISRQALDVAKSTYSCVCSAYGGENRQGGDGTDWHLFRCPHPDSLLELELLLQSILTVRQPPFWRGGDSQPEVSDRKQSRVLADAGLCGDANSR